MGSFGIYDMGRFLLGRHHYLRAGGPHHPGGEEFWTRHLGGGEKFWTSRQGGAKNFGQAAKGGRNFLDLVNIFLSP